MVLLLFLALAGVTGSLELVARAYDCVAILAFVLNIEPLITFDT